MSDSVTILYQMGKVGSTTVHNALKASDLKGPLQKVHFLSDTGLAHSEKFHKETLKKPWNKAPFAQEALALRKRIANEPDLKINIVTLVREPIRREVSEFFQYVQYLHPELLDDDGNLKTHRASRVIQARFMFYDESKNYTCRWFDTEIKELFDVDVFDHPFDHNRGYTLIEQGNVRLLVFRLEDVNRTLNDGLRLLLGSEYKDWEGQANVGEKKQSGDQYRSLLESFKMRASICDKVYSSRYARHFYTDQERLTFREKWSQ